jgi:hypothetical protein
VTKYNRTTRQFTPTTSLGVLASLGGGQYTAKNDAAGTLPNATGPVFAAFAAEASDAMAYAYFAENPTLITPNGNVKLYDNVASVAQTFGTLDYVSAANVSACENCHGKPYMKHGYRAGTVTGLPDLAACKACHYDTRAGHDQGFQCLVDDPAAFAAGTCETKPEYPYYSYTASTMNDTHMSHAMEFAYPQSMANCVTCHAGKLTGTDGILTQANFKLETCKSCHPVSGVGGTDPKRAPALKDIMPATTHAFLGDLYNYTGMACNSCHTDANAAIKFAAIHTGYNNRIYKADGTKYASTVTTTIDSVAFDTATKILTVNFSVAGADAGAIFKPTVVMSLYGYDTKDFLISGHSSTGGVRNLEATFGTDTTRLQIAQGATSNAFVATANLTTWATQLADGSVKKVEIGVLPALGLNQAATPDNAPMLAGADNTLGTADDVVNAAYNPFVAIAGATKSFDLVGNGGTADAYGKGTTAIVDPAKCNKCHDALGTTFHSPTYGSAGVVACRLCHTIASGGSHLEMQSRSIDSYVHAIHSFQAFDVSGIDFADPVEELEYEHHIESTYPNFTILNCESCHVKPAAGKPANYEVPDQSKSLPGLLSKASTLTGKDRAIGAIPAYVTGPASRACGSCHRAELIKEDDAAGLASFNSHTDTFGYMLDATTNSAGVLDAAIKKIMAFFQ